MAAPIGGAGTLTLASSSGAITQSAAVTVATLTASADTGIALTNAGNAVGSFSAANAISGDVSLANSGALTIAGLGQQGPGNVNVVNAGAIAVDGPVSSLGGTIVVIADGANAAANVNANVISGNGPVTLQATGALTIGAVITVNSETGTLTLAADVNADQTGDSNSGALSIQSGAVVFSANSSTSAITLRGAAVNFDTSSYPALVGADRKLVTTSVSTTLSGLNAPYALAFDSSGNLFVANAGGTTVSKFREARHLRPPSPG